VFLGRRPPGIGYICGMSVRPALIAEELVGEEWAEWYRLSPSERSGRDHGIDRGASHAASASSGLTVQGCRGNLLSIDFNSA